MTELKNWSCINYKDISRTANKVNLQAAGEISGDPRFRDGTYVITSRIISSNGRSIITESGTHYYLVGNPESGWAELCEDKGWVIDPENIFGADKPILLDKKL